MAKKAKPAAKSAKTRPRRRCHGNLNDRRGSFLPKISIRWRAASSSSAAAGARRDQEDREDRPDLAPHCPCIKHPTGVAGGSPGGSPRGSPASRPSTSVSSTKAFTLRSTIGATPSPRVSVLRRAGVAARRRLAPALPGEGIRRARTPSCEGLSASPCPAGAAAMSCTRSRARYTAAPSRGTGWPAPASPSPRPRRTNRCWRGSGRGARDPQAVAGRHHRQDPAAAARAPDRARGVRQPRARHDPARRTAGAAADWFRSAPAWRWRARSTGGCCVTFPRRCAERQARGWSRRSR